MHVTKNAQKIMLAVHGAYVLLQAATIRPAVQQQQPSKVTISFARSLKDQSCTEKLTRCWCGNKREVQGQQYHTIGQTQLQLAWTLRHRHAKVEDWATQKIKIMPDFPLCCRPLCYLLVFFSSIILLFFSIFLIYGWLVFVGPNRFFKYECSVWNKKKKLKSKSIKGRQKTAEKCT